MAQPSHSFAGERLPVLAGGLFVIGAVVSFVGIALFALLYGRVDAALLTVWRDPVIHQVLRFTLLQAALSTLLSLAFAIPVASALARQRRFPGRIWLIRLMAVPMGLPVLIGALGLIGIWGRQGLGNQALQFLGLDQPISIYGLTGILIALGEPSKEPARKIGWVETVTLDLHGWTVHADRKLVDGEASALGKRALSMLANHLERIAILVPEKPLADLRKCQIRIEHSHPELGNMQYHPDVDWLDGHGYDPKLVKMVHIPQATELLSRDQLLKHPAVILHELAHAYHDQFLGFDEPKIIKAYDDALKKGIDDKALLHTGETVKHYATTNHKEYFAEATEAYLYRNDFYPFVRAELHAHDPEIHAIMKTVWEPVE